MAAIDPSAEDFRDYYPIVEDFLECLQDKKVQDIQLVATTEEEDGSVSSQVFYFNSGARQLSTAAGVLQMLANKLFLEDEDDDD